MSSVPVEEASAQGDGAATPPGDVWVISELEVRGDLAFGTPVRLNSGCITKGRFGVYELEDGSVLPIEKVGVDDLGQWRERRQGGSLNRSNRTVCNRSVCGLPRPLHDD